MATRGSEKLLREKAISKKEIERLWKLLEDDEVVRLVSWETRGTPAIDHLVGALKCNSDAAGAVVDKLVRAEGLRLRLDLFPYGIPWPDEILLNFSQGPQVR